METANGVLKIRFEVKGVSPLLMNPMPEGVLLNLRDKKKKAKSAQATVTPREEAGTKVYQTAEGKPYVPAKWLMSALIVSGRYSRLDGKRQMSTKDSSLVPGMVQIDEMLFPLRTEGGKMAKWEVDLQQGRNPNGGEAVCIVRPRFDDWCFTATIFVDTSQINEDSYRELVDRALDKVGLGDFRPAKRGTFGRSVVASWKVL